MIKRSRLGALLGAVALLAAVGACGAVDDPAQASDPSPTPTEAPDYWPSGTDDSATSEAEDTPEPPTTGEDAAALAWLKESFQGTSWIDSIQGVDHFGSALSVRTNLYPDADADEAASKICSAVSSYEFTELGEFTGVRVTASNGERLIFRMSLGDRCEP